MCTQLLRIFNSVYQYQNSVHEKRTIFNEDLMLSPSEDGILKYALWFNKTGFIKKKIN